MKIAYVANWDVSRPSGVYDKMARTVKVWRELGEDAHLFVTSPSKKFSVSEDFETIFSLNSGKIGNSFSNYLSKISTAAALRKSLEKFQPDVIYYRMGIWYPGLDGILQLGKKLVVEINSYDRAEMRNEAWLKQKIYFWGRERILVLASGFVSMTEELIRLNSLPHEKSFVSGNGTVFDTNTSARVSSERPQTIFVGTDGQAWHGVDKIFELAAKLKNIDFHIVGIDPKPYLKISNLIFHGNLFGAELENLYRKMDVGIGTLALHRKQMNDACPLKVREYARRGLPLILGYHDPDLNPAEHILQLENEEHNLIKNQKKIEDFIFRFKGAPHNSERYKASLSAANKEKLRIQFLKGL